MKRSVEEKMKGRKTKCIVISILFMLLILLTMLFANESQAAERYGEFYELNNNCITRILPQTTFEDLRNNLEKDSIQVTNEEGNILEDNEYVGTGMNLIDGQNTYKISVVGDLDGNGRISITDLSKMKLHTGKLNVLEGAYLKSADLNNDGKVSITDLSQLMLAVVNMKDIIAPQSFKPEVETTKNTIVVSALAVDANSGIGGYSFRLDNGGWLQNEVKTNGIYVFENVDLSVSHNVTVKVEDKAGNIKKTKGSFVKEQIGSINIIPSTTEWTNQNIRIAAEYDINKLNTKKMLSIDNGVTFVEYEGPVEVEKNTRVIAQIRNLQNEVLEEKTYNVTNIDKISPKDFTPELTLGRKDVTITVAVEDGEATSEYGQSGIKEYEYIIKVGLWQWKITSQDTTYVFNTLKPEEVYAVEVIAKDNAGNKTRVETENVTVKSGYTLRFNANGGTVEPESITKEAGEVIELPTPERTYTISYETNGGESIEDTVIESEFQGWYTQSAGGEEVTYRTMPEMEEDSQTLYAQWRTPYAFLPTPTREKYRFLGWYDNENLEGIGIRAGESYAPTSDITYYAKWELAEFDLTFEYNGAISENAELTRKITYNEAYGELPEPERIYTLTYKSNDGREDVTQTKEYEFLGWYKEATFDTEITAETIVNITGDHTIYAKWNEYEVEIASPEERTGYTFEGWYENSAFEGEKYNAEDTLTLEKDMTFYAKWAGENFGVTYEYNGATTGNLELGKNVTYGAKYGELPTPERKYTVTLYKNNGTENEEREIEYTFGGWYKEDTFETEVTANTTVQTVGVHTIYAKWTEAGTTLPELSREGYIFGGWFENSTFTSDNAYEGETQYTPTGAISFYAKWTLIDYTIIYELDGGAAATENPTEYNIETETFTLNNPTKEGYTFTGWSGTGIEGTQEEVTIEKGSTGNRTYTANWTANTDTAYTVIHKKMNVDGTTYTEVEEDRVEGTGTTGTEITPEVKTYEGFISPSTQTEIIAENGSTTITYLYERNKYQFTLGTGTGVNTTGSTATGEYYHGATITLKLVAAEEYENPVWTSSNTTLVPSPTSANTTFTMPIGAITMTPSATQSMVNGIFATLYDTDNDNVGDKLVYTANSRTIPAYGTKIEQYNLTSGIENISIPWNNQRENITSAKIEDIIKPTSARYLFGYLDNVTSIEDIEKLDTSNVTNMNNMFSECNSLTSLDLSNFNTSSVTSMAFMFDRCSDLINLNLNSFDTGNVTNMNGMFSGCNGLTGLDLSSFNTSNVTYMQAMFSGCIKLTSLNVSNFNTSNVTEMENMFANCCRLTELDVSNFDITNVEIPEWGEIFYDCSNLTTIYGNPTWQKVNNTPIDAFYNCGTDYVIINPVYATLYDTDNDNVGDKLVYTANSRTIPAYGTKIDQYNITNGISRAPWYDKINNITSAKIEDVIEPTSIRYLFANLSRITSIENIEKLNTSNATDMNHMFYNCRGLTSIDLSSFNTSSVTDMSSMFYNCNSLTSLNLSSFNTGNVTNMRSMFEMSDDTYSYTLKTITFGDNFNTGNVTNMCSMFTGCCGLTNLDLSTFDTSKVTNMNEMFTYCHSLTQLDLSNFNTSNVTNMGGMFHQCHDLVNIDLSSFNTSNVTDMNHMFYNCRGLTSIDLSSFDTSNVTNMDGMFWLCKNLTSLDLSNFITSSVGIGSPTNMYPSMSDMFAGCSSLTSLNISSFNTSNIIHLYDMFNGCSALTELDLSSFDITNVTTYGRLFEDCTNLTTIYGNSTWQKVNDTPNGAFDNCGTDHVIINKVCATLYDTDSDNTGDALIFTSNNRVISEYGTMIDQYDIAELEMNQDTIPWKDYGGSITSVDIVDEIRPKSTAYMFYYLNQITSIGHLENLKTNTVRNMSNMFANCNQLTTLDVSSFETKNVTNMSGMFGACKFETLDLSNFDTRNVTNISGMFTMCSNLKNLDLSNFNTSKVVNMSTMFWYCTDLESVDLSSFDTSNVTNTRLMFATCEKIETLDLRSFDTSNITNSDRMFDGCESLNEVKVTRGKWTIDSEEIFSGLYDSTPINSVTYYD